MSDRARRGLAINQHRMVGLLLQDAEYRLHVLTGGDLHVLAWSIVARALTQLAEQGATVGEQITHRMKRVFARLGVDVCAVGFLPRFGNPGPGRERRGRPVFGWCAGMSWRSEEHTSELQSLMRNTYA